MRRKVAAVWVSLLIMVSSIVVLVEIADKVEAPTTLYVGGGGGGNYSKIQWAIDNASDGDTVFVYNGTYYEIVVVNKTITLTGENRDITIIDGGGSGDVVNVSSNWINITGFTIKGGLGFSNSGIKLYGTTYCRVFNNNVSWNYNGIFLSENSSNNSISENNISYNSRDGISISVSSNNTIKDNNILSNDMNGILLTTSPSNNIIGNNLISNQRNGIDCRQSSNNTLISYNRITLTGSYGIYLDSSSNNKLIQNNLLSNTVGIHVGSSFNNLIANNEISSHIPGIHLWMSSNNIIKSNIFTNNGIYIEGYELSNYNSHEITDNFVNGKPLYYYKNSSGINLDGIPVGQLIIANCSDFYLKNLQINNTDMGIEVAYSTNFSVITNNVSNNHWGIYLYSSHRGKIENNFVFNNSMGIYIRSSSNNTIDENYVSSNRGNGLLLTSSSKDNLVANNILIFNYFGINLASSLSNNTILNNHISNSYNGVFMSSSANNNKLLNNDILSSNNYGIYISSGTYDNIIYHNNFINNKNQAYDGTNKGIKWDNDYPSGGNYGSDFDETDEGAYDDYNGIDQLFLGSDGIVDNGTVGGGGKNPYIIDSNSQDNYPLMSPIGNLTYLNEGWNLISIPFIQSDENSGNVLASIKKSYTAIQWYNTTDFSDPWKHNCSLKPPNLNDLNNIDHLMGFWINITYAGGVLFEYSGTQPTSNQTIQLYKGWNMVGYPSLTSHNRTVGLNNLTFDTHVDCIQWYDAGTKTWHFMGPDDSFVPGRGYWMYSKVDAEWEVPL
jgi:parallel beta-helix repeat protein